MDIYEDEVAAMMSIHDASMSEDEWKAAIGRCSKIFLPSFLKWFNAERERAHNANEVPGEVATNMTVALVETAIILLVNHIMNTADTETGLDMKVVVGLRKAVWKHFETQFEERLNEAAEAVAGRRREGGA